MLESVGGPVSGALLLLAKAADEVLCLGRHSGGVLEALEVLHDLLHLQFVNAFFPDRMPPRQQVKHDDSRGPHVCFLCVSEDIRHLLRRLVQKRTALRKVRDCVQRVLHRQAKVNQLHSTQVLVTAKDDVVRLDVPVDYVLLVMQVRQSLEQTLHDLGAHFFRQANLPSSFLVFL